MSIANDIESELKQSVPRRVRYGVRPPYGLIIFLFVVFVLAVLLPLRNGKVEWAGVFAFWFISGFGLSSALAETSRHKNLVRLGVPVRATVVSKSVQGGHKGGEWYAIHYTFLAKGVVVEGESRFFDRALWESLADNSLLTVLYDCNKPKTNILYCAAEYKAILDPDSSSARPL